MGSPARGTRVPALCLAFAVLVAGQDVQQLDDQPPGETWFLDEGRSKMWAKSGKVPATTSFYKTIQGYEHHGKCRFACYQEKTCGGYSWVPATHTCKLFSAPNFLVSPFSNDRWHRDAAQVTGKKYKKDQSTTKARAKLSKGLHSVKKAKPIHKRAKTQNGHIHLGLEKVANKALKRDARKAKGADSRINITLKVYKAKLYSEFTKKYRHEYEARTERAVSKRARAIADKRVKTLNKKHKKKITRVQALGIYKQAKKEVEGHAVRQMQRSFKKHLKSWTNAKVYAKREQLATAKTKARTKARKKTAKKKKKTAAAMKKPMA